MAVTIVATPGASNANSYITEAEATSYFAARLPLSPPWSAAADKTAALAMATRVLDMLAVPHRTLRRVDGVSYYYTSRQWTGAIASSTQALAWPRTGMYDRFGREIASTVIPSELKDAQAELAGQLVIADTTLDNAVIVGGIKSVSAGSVSVSFKDMIEKHVLPDAVWSLMPASWFTDELVEPALRAEIALL
jgi:hypothetical protein